MKRGGYPISPAVRRPGFLGAAVALCLVLAGSACTYRGQAMDEPLTRRATWFSFVAGEDIRAACTPRSTDRYRLIYNGFWHDQVRIYELGLSQPRQLDMRALGPPDLTGISTSDLLAPWRGRVGTVSLDAQRYDQLVAAFVADDLFGAPPVGLLLPSDGYYWTAVACRGGKFFYNAWLYPGARFAHLAFPGILLALDTTGEPYNQPNSMAYATTFSQPELQRERWSIQVRQNGLSVP